MAREHLLRLRLEAAFLLRLRRFVAEVRQRPLRRWCSWRGRWIHTLHMYFVVVRGITWRTQERGAADQICSIRRRVSRPPGNFDGSVLDLRDASCRCRLRWPRRSRVMGLRIVSGLLPLPRCASSARSPVGIRLYTGRPHWSQVRGKTEMGTTWIVRGQYQLSIKMPLFGGEALFFPWPAQTFIWD